MKILVLGSSGMAGHLVSLYLAKQGHKITTQAHTKPLDKQTKLVDVHNIAHLDELLNEDDFDAVVNCIGLLVKDAEDHKDRAVYINSFLPHHLEQVFNKRSTRVIHISSDGVFSGKSGPYSEKSPHDGQSFYGRTKSLGELDNKKDLTVRTSIIGPDVHSDGGSLLNWILQEEGEINGFEDVIWNGVTTLELAKAVNAALQQNLVGVLNLSPSKAISKYDLLKLIKKVFNLSSVSINPKSGNAGDYTLLSERRDFRYRVPDYQVMLNDLKNWIDNHSELYKHYEK